MKVSNYLYQVVTSDDKTISYTESVASTRKDAREIKSIVEKDTGKKHRILKYEAVEYVR